MTLVALTLGTAPRLADILARHPDAMDALLEPSFFGALPDEAALADPDLYVRDPRRFAALMAAIEKKRGEKEAAEMRWLEVAEMAEGLA